MTTLEDVLRLPEEIQERLADIEARLRDLERRISKP